MSNQRPGIVGTKLGFTQFFTETGDVVRCTVVESNIVVLKKRTKEKDGYVALVLGMKDAKEKHLTKAQSVAFKKMGQPAKRVIKELRCSEEFAAKYEAGATMKLDEIFTVGERVDAQGTSKGRGFTGVMRRWNFAGAASSTHGTHEYKRHGGSIGTNMTPGRTLPNLKMPGHWGDELVTMQGLRLARIDVENNLLMIEGGVPGSKNGLVVVRQTAKKKAASKAGR